MKDIMERAKHEINELRKTNDGAYFEITLKVSMSYGFIKDYKFWTETTQGKQHYDLAYVNQEGEFACYSAEIFLPTWAIYHYYFTFTGNDTPYMYNKKHVTTDLTILWEDFWKLSVNFTVPEKFIGGIEYHILPDRFYRGSENSPEVMEDRIFLPWGNDPIIGPVYELYEGETASGLIYEVKDESKGINQRFALWHDGIDPKRQKWCNDFYGGDLKGITQKIPYLKEKLCIDSLFLGPLSESSTYHGYNAGDYKKIDPYKGTLEDLKELCDVAHSYGISVIVDIVLNHSGTDGRFLNLKGKYDIVGAAQSKDSPYSSYLCVTYDEQGNLVDYETWFGMKDDLIKHNCADSEYRKYVFDLEDGLLAMYTKAGVDGFRYDVADELPDSFLIIATEVCEKLNPEMLSRGEIWIPAIGRGRLYIESGKALLTTMNYQWPDGLWRYVLDADYNSFIDSLKNLLILYPEDTLNSMSNATSTHDKSRGYNIYAHPEWYTRYSECRWHFIPTLDDKGKSWEWIRNYHITHEEYERGKDGFKSFIAIEAFFKGVWTIFYGDEVGLTGPGNIANRGSYPWGKEDLDMLEWTSKVAHTRHDNSFLRRATMRDRGSNSQYGIYERYSEETGEGILVVFTTINVQNDVFIDLPEEYLDSEILLSRHNEGKNKLSKNGILILKKN